MASAEPLEPSAEPTPTEDGINPIPRLREEKCSWIGQASASCAAQLPNPSETPTTAADDEEVRNVAKVVVGMRERFQQCYREQQVRSPDAEGKVRIVLHVDCEGRIVRIDAASEGIEKDTVMCMFQIRDEAEFAPPSKGTLRVSIPVTFVKSNMERVR